MVRAACMCPPRRALLPSARAGPAPPPAGRYAARHLPRCRGSYVLVRSGSSNLLQHPPLFDADRHHLHGVTLFPQRLAPLEVELPAVPWTCNDGALLVDLHPTGRAPVQPAAHDPKAQRALLVRAAVVNGEEAVLPTKDADLMARRAHEAEPPFLEILGRPAVD